MGFQFANLAVRFLLELCTLGAIGYWGFHSGSNWGMKFALGFGGPLLIAWVWGRWVAPQAAARLPDPLRLILEVVIFSLASAALAAAGQSGLAWIFGLLVAANLILMFVFKQRGL